MTTADILLHRLFRQGLNETEFTSPEEVVSGLGAVQSQDYPGAKWALAQRLPKLNDGAIEKAFTEGKILRTHVMRPTWHFVHPNDITWMLQLTGPRVSKAMSSYNKLLELNESVFTKSHKTITRLLTKQKTATRDEIKSSLAEVGIETNVQRLAHLVMQAELDQILISGPRRGSPAPSPSERGSPKGRQFTYMLFSDRVPEVKSLTPDEALLELVKRYFTSHGPAQIEDFVWWSGLTKADAKKGLEMNRKSLISEDIKEKTYYFSPNLPNLPNLPNSVFLLPNYDEYTIAYKDRSAFYDAESGIKIYTMGALAYPHVVLHMGKVIGIWRREIKKDRMIIRPKFAEKPDEKVYKEFRKIVEKYEEFLGMTVKVEEK